MQLRDGNIYKGQLKRLISQYFVSFSLSRLLFVYNFAVISNGMSKYNLELFRLPSPGRNCRRLSVWQQNGLLFCQFSCYPPNFRK